MMGVLSRRNAVSLVNARLESLGHAQDFITVDAIDALHARAGHEAGAFGAALGAVLFLAATEHAPRIESAHVERAVPAQEMPPAARPRRVWPMILAGMAGAAMGAALAVLLIQRPRVVAASRPAPTPPAMVSPAPAVVVALQPKTVPRPAPPPVALPQGPPLRLSLVVPAGDRETASRFTALAVKLRQYGFGDVQLQSINSARKETRPFRHHVVYFFKQDAPFAKNVAGALDSAEESYHIANAWAPILVPEAAGSTSHPPGSIDVFAP